MAALFETAPRISSLQLVDLRQLSPRDMAPLLDEEVSTWLRVMNWDFGKSADLVSRFVGMHALNGCALMSGGAVAGYSYYVFEDHKGLIGDLFLREAYRTVGNENRMLEAVLQGLTEAPYVRRIESQLMLLTGAPERTLPGSPYLSSYDRDFMVLDLALAPEFEPRRPPPRIYVEHWSEQHQEAAAHLIANAYAQHIDSRINDQYRTPAGARRFLYNIVQYPGCGTFFKAASLTAFERDSERLAGVCLSSLVGPMAGHITQICVSREARGTGVGYELLRQSLSAFRESGCRTISLTVTSANQEAIRLYRSMGFVTRRRFSAYVWEGF